MKRSLLIGAAALLATTAGTYAADMPYPTKAPDMVAMAPAFSWTGLYLGGNAGYGWGTTDSDNNALFDAGPDYTLGVGLYPGANQSMDLNGWVAGGQIGYNYQLENNWVVGVEADFQWTGAENDSDLLASVNGPYFQNSGELEWFGTVRARLGYAMDRLLVYGTGGFAYGKVSASSTVAAAPGGIPLWETATSGSDDSVLTGWTVGGGLEYALTDNWILRGEYLYVDLGSSSLTLPLAGTGGSYINTDASVTQNIVRAAISYKF